jgi:DNA-directed RNA polymerase specialized sigma24 family protein
MAMCKVANTAHLHQAQRRDVRREEPQRGLPPLLEGRLASWMAELHDHDALDPADVAIFREEFDRLLSLLPEELQQLFVWKLEGHTNAEIGQRINRTERTVELKMRIIRKTLERGLDTRVAEKTGPSAFNKSTLNSPV